MTVTESGLNGPCRNPWDTTLNAGGSSGGAAAALAAGLCPIAHGTDGGGSIRIPASCCGMVGLKPARGRVSRAPYAGFEGLPTDGPIARTVADAAAFLDADRGLRTRRCLVGAAARSTVRGGGGLAAGAPPGRGHGRAAGRRPGCRAVPPGRPRAGELLAGLGHDGRARRAPDWGDPRSSSIFVRIWQVGSALMPVADRSLLDPLNRVLADAARRHQQRRLRALGDRAVGLRAPDRRVLGALRRAGHTGACAAVGPGRLDDRRGDRISRPQCTAARASPRSRSSRT